MIHKYLTGCTPAEESFSDLCVETTENVPSASTNYGGIDNSFFAHSIIKAIEIVVMGLVTIGMFSRGCSGSLN